MDSAQNPSSQPSKPHQATEIPSTSGSDVEQASLAKNQAGTESRSKSASSGPLRPSDVDFMPSLLRSLSVLLHLKGKAVSPQFLMTGLGGGSISPQSCLRAARKAGLSGSIMYRPSLDNIPTLVFPCILLLS